MTGPASDARFSADIAGRFRDAAERFPRLRFAAAAFHPGDGTPGEAPWLRDAEWAELLDLPRGVGWPATVPPGVRFTIGGRPWAGTYYRDFRGLMDDQAERLVAETGEAVALFERLADEAADLLDDPTDAASARCPAAWLAALAASALVAADDDGRPLRLRWTSRSVFRESANLVGRLLCPPSAASQAPTVAHGRTAGGDEAGGPAGPPRPLAEQKPAPASASGGAMKPAWEKAILAFQFAEQKQPPDAEPLTAAAAHAWLTEHGPSEYKLPAVKTFERYLRAARRASGAAPLNSPRAGRTGRSVVRRDRI